MTNAIAIQDGHGHVVARPGVVPIWHSHAKRQFVPDPWLQVDLVHQDTEELLDDGVLTVMANHKPAMAATGILIDKLIVAGWHVHCTHLDDKRVDAHDELGEHGNERAVNLAGRHWNIWPRLQIQHRLDDLVQVNIGGKW